MRFTGKISYRAFGLLLCLALLLPWGTPLASAAPTTTEPVALAPEDAGSFQADIPGAAYLASLDKGNRAPLIWLEGQKYTLSLSRIKVEDAQWVRAVLTTKDDTFAASTLLGPLAELREQERLRIDVVRARQGGSTTIAFTTLPGELQVASLRFPMTFSDDVSLTGAASGAGGKLIFTGGSAPAVPTPGSTAPAQGGAEGGEAEPRNNKALYVVLALLVLLLLAATVCLVLFRKQVSAVTAPMAAKAALVRERLAPAAEKCKAWLRKTSKNISKGMKALGTAAAARYDALRAWLKGKPARPAQPAQPARSAQPDEPDEPTGRVPRKTPAVPIAPIEPPIRPAPVPPIMSAAAPRASTALLEAETAEESAPELAPEPPAFSSSLAGVELIPAERAGSLVETVSMDGMLPASDDMAEAAPDETAILNAFFLGKRQSVPPVLGFITVGLRNRDILLGLPPGPEAPAPLFAPNLRGQVFSLSAAGNLFLHIDYFAPPSFVVHSVLGNVCLEHVFDLVNTQGRGLRAEEVRNRKILEILPARTRKTEEGYFEVVEKGRLLIGSI